MLKVRDTADYEDEAQVQEMDIYKYIESRAMREHLESINYEFNAMEAAWIIFRSKLTFNQQNEAWQKVIALMPDCVTAEGGSIHSLLKESIEERVKTFVDLTDENGKYIYDTDCYEGRFADICFYDSFKKCFDDALENSIMQDMDSFTIGAHLKNSSRHYALTFLNNGEIKSISEAPCEIKMKEEALRNMEITLPHPFVTGDILAFRGNPVVVAPQEENNFKSLIGVYMWMYEKICYETVPYFFLDRYYGDFDNNAIIRKISHYFKGKKKLDEILNDYHLLLLENKKF